MGEAGALAALGIEVLGGEPALEAGADGGPFAVDDGVTGGIAVFALPHHVVAGDAFEGEAEAGGGVAGGLVAAVAAPLPAAVAQRGEGVVGDEEEGLGGDAAAGEFAANILPIVQ